MRTLLFGLLLAPCFTAPAQQPVPALSAPFPALEACIQAIAARSDGPRQVHLCKDAADEAESRPRPDKILAFQYAATAFRLNNQKDHALHFADKAVKNAAQASPTDPATASAYLVRAQCRQALKDIFGAEEDAEVAEKDQRLALETATEASRPALVKEFKETLRYHASLLKELRREGDAIARLQEASKL